MNGPQFFRRAGGWAICGNPNVSGACSGSRPRAPAQARPRRPSGPMNGRPHPAEGPLEPAMNRVRGDSRRAAPARSRSAIRGCGIFRPGSSITRRQTRDVSGFCHRGISETFRFGPPHRLAFRAKVVPQFCLDFCDASLNECAVVRVREHGQRHAVRGQPPDASIGAALLWSAGVPIGAMSALYCTRADSLDGHADPFGRRRETNRKRGS